MAKYSIGRFLYSIWVSNFLLTIALSSTSLADPKSLRSERQHSDSNHRNPLRDWLINNIIKRESNLKTLNPSEVDSYLGDLNLHLKEFKKLLPILVSPANSTYQERFDFSNFQIQFNSGYELSTSDPFLILHDKTARHPTVLLNRTKVFNNFILELPHSDREPNSLMLGFSIIEKLRPRAVIISGLSRCSISKESQCSAGGTTSVCSSGGIKKPFPMSDAAHSLDTLFDTTHRILVDLWPKSLVLQLHDARKLPYIPLAMVLSSGTDPKRPLSNPSSNLTSLTLAALKKILREELSGQIEPELIESCQSYEKHPALSSIQEFARHKRVMALCATTNIQGRYLNLHLPNALSQKIDSLICSPEMPQNESERFIHIEAMAHDLDFSIESDATNGFIRAFERFMMVNGQMKEKEIEL